jgi:hypothetical protein
MSDTLGNILVDELAPVDVKIVDGNVALVITLASPVHNIDRIIVQLPGNSPIDLAGHLADAHRECLCRESRRKS